MNHASTYVIKEVVDMDLRQMTYRVFSWTSPRRLTPINMTLCGQIRALW